MTLQQTLSYEASSLSFGSFEKLVSKEIHHRWKDALSLGYEKEPVSIEKRKEAWKEIAGWLN